ncbi:MAG: hypothetical protein ACOH5I_21855 [Oligoflexus sp.]
MKSKPTLEDALLIARCNGVTSPSELWAILEKLLVDWAEWKTP